MSAMRYALDEGHELVFVFFIGSRKLIVDSVQYRVLVGSVAEYRAVVLFKLLLEFTNEGKIRTAVGVNVQKLPCVLNRPVRLDDVVRELEGDVLIGAQVRMIGQRGRGGLEVYHVERILPALHLCPQRVCKDNRFVPAMLHAVDEEPRNTRFA